jgi:hypothetical protein
MNAKLATVVACATLVSALSAQQTGPKTHARLGIGTSTMYFFRGMMQQDGGIIVQPELAIGRDGGEVFNRPFGWHLGTWNSLHEGQTGTGKGGGSPAWYESQFFAGFTVDVIDKLEVRTRYTAYHSPNGGFRIGAATPTQELSFKAKWDDSEGKGNSRLRGIFPYAELAFELAGGRDAGVDRGTYLELGVEPVIAATDDLLVKAPVRLGLSLKDYYEDGRGGGDFFGFISFGAETTFDLCDDTSIFGPWKLECSLAVYILGDTAKRFNNGDNTDLVGGLNLVLTF